ncbi:DUF397 domain-containing protein [Streptomyces sp. NPDC018019]|uniref:DUF397 domain-containing protein n=1 Tax=Streptomyces sp. NPDC018019 TaxID=3365030 RepID=UPI00379A16C0
MSAPNWQKSSYCAEGNNCLNVAASPDHTIRIRESETPHTVLTTSQTHLGFLIGAIKRDTLTPDA